MKPSPLTALAAGILAAAMAMTTPAVGVADPGPITLQQLCDAQMWPRPIPDVAGLLFDTSMKQIVTGGEGGALACWDNVRSVTQDGQDAHKLLGPQQITSISPPAGTSVGHHDPVTVQVAPIDYSVPKEYRPCDWVTTSEATKFLGVPEPAITEPSGDGAGSVDISCGYRNPRYLHNVTSELMMPGAFPVDAASTYALNSDESDTAVGGLGLAARCYTNPHGSQDNPFTVLHVLLEGNRIYTATGWGNEPCDTLKRFAQTAIGRL